MKSKKDLLESSRLYLIIDRSVCRLKDATGIARSAASAGADMVQLRDKSGDTAFLLDTAVRLRSVLRPTKTPLIINDNIDIAKIADADGLHIGQTDVSLRLARRILGVGSIIGVSCATLKQALDAQRGGADYIGVGAVFPTSTKPGAHLVSHSRIVAIREALAIPVFVLGGITMDNLPGLVHRGFRRVAVSRSICCAMNIASRTRQMKKILSN